MIPLEENIARQIEANIIYPAFFFTENNYFLVSYNDLESYMSYTSFNVRLYASKEKIKDINTNEIVLITKLFPVSMN